MAQVDTIWFDKNWEKAERISAAFFRPRSVSIGDGYMIKDYYINGKLQMQGISLSKEKLIWDGILTSYYENGRLRDKVLFSNGEKNGLTEVFYSSGVTALKASYLKSREHGPYIQYNENGIMVSKENYVQGNREGLKETFYSSGKIKERYYYTNDERNGLYETFYENGRPKEKYNYANGEQDGETIAYHPNGNILYKGQYLNGVLDGAWQFNPSSEKNIQAVLSKGKLTGPYTVFYKNEQQVKASFYNDSLLSWTSFYNNGKPLRQLRFNPDSLTEEWTSYKPDGRLWLQTIYRFNLPYGEWKFYDQGQLRRSFLFEYETIERSLRHYQYKKDKLKEDALKNEEEIKLKDIEKIESYFPVYYAQAEQLLQKDKDTDSYTDYGTVTNYYAGGNISIKTVLNYDSIFTSVDFLYNSGINETASLNDLFKVKHFSDADGLKLILQYDQYKPAENEVGVFAEPPSENRIRVLRLALGKGSKNNLLQKTVLIKQLAGGIYKTQTAGFSQAAITAAICYELYDK